MNETIKKLSEQVRAKISEAFGSDAMREFVAATKAADHSGSFEVIISTADIDRQGESIDQSGWDLGFYLQNPIVLWAHDYDSLPIAICDEIAVKDGKLVARGRFAPASANPFAQQVRRLYDLKIVRATSVGFIVKDQQGNKINKAELLEFSFVPVPANPYALSTARAQALGLNLEMLAMKGINFEKEPSAKALPPDSTPQEGDPCKLDDGSEGEWTAGENGTLVCKIAIKPTEGAPCTTSDGKEGMWKQGETGMICVVKATPTPVPPAEQPPDTPQEGDACKMPDGSPGEYEMDDDTNELVCIPKVEEKPKTAVVTTAIQDECVKHEQELTAAAVAHTNKIIELLGGGAQGEAGKAFKIGRVLSEKNRSLIKSAIEQFKLSIVALEELLTATEPQGGAGEEQPKDGAAPNERSSAAGYGSLEELNQVLQLRSVLRSINNGSAQALENINRRLRNPKK